MHGGLNSYEGAKGGGVWHMGVFGKVLKLIEGQCITGI